MDAGIKDSRSLGRQILRGMLWSGLAAVLIKAISLGGQVIAPRYLDPQDFGNAAIAISISSFCLFLAPGNFSPLLIRERSDFQQVAGQVFWLALTASVLAGLFLLLAAFYLHDLFASAPLAPKLLLVVAAALPLQALPIIYAAKLSRELNMRAISLVNLGAGLVATLAMLALAITGWGAYAIVTPIWLAAAYSALTFRFVSGPIGITQPRPHLWGAILRSVFWIVAYSGANALYAYIPQLVVGLIFGTGPAGLFYWAWLLSGQLVALVSSSVQTVMFPALTRIEDDLTRRTEVFFLSYRLLLVVGGGIALIQALTADAMVTALFDRRWHGASQIVCILSVAAISQPAYALTTSHLLANGEFRKLAISTFLATLITMTAVAASALYGGSLTIVAACASIGWAFSHFVIGGMISSSLGIGPRAYVRAIAVPCVSTALSYIASLITISVSPPTLWSLAAACAVGGLVYVGLIATLMRHQLCQVAGRLGASRR